MTTIQNKSTVQNTQDFITIQDLFYLCLNKWHWFVISLVLCLGVATFYLLRTPSVYVRTASILIKDDSKGKSSSADMESFSDLGLFKTNTNVYNEIGTLQSPDIMREVVSRLHLEMNYQTDGRFHKQTVYGNQLPVQVSIPNLSENESATFELHLAKDGSVELSSFTRNGTEIENADIVKGNLNDSIQSPLGPVVVVPSVTYSGKMESTIYVTRQSLAAASAGCSANLTISQNDEKSNIITLSFQDVSTQRAEDVLNTLIAVYNENWVRDKNQIAVSTSMFINERLGVIEGELGNVDDDISSFKSEHLLPDVQAAASMYMTQANEANTAIRELNNQAYMARYIRNYLTNETNKYQLLPANYGIENASLSTQLNEYNTKLLERNSLVAHSSTKNPLVREMDKSLDAMRNALISSIDNQMVALREQIRSLEAIGGKATSQIASNPKQSKYLLSVERQQKVKESLYLYLLQKREENAITLAATANNAKIIDEPAAEGAPVSPKPRIIYLIALVVGVGLPVSIIFFIGLTKFKIEGRGDVEKLTSLPIVGDVPLTEEANGSIAVFENQNTLMSETFRNIRTNLQFMLENDQKVILVTSTVSGEGKSFISSNLAISLSLLGKKVVIVGLDIRKPGLNKIFNLPRKEQGITQYLSNPEKNLIDFVQPSDVSKNLFILPGGTVPPNPTELLARDSLDKAIEVLKKNFDYIILDTAPVGMVTDTLLVGRVTDLSVYVCRADYTRKAEFTLINELADSNKLPNLCTVINGLDLQKKKYGYYYGYGKYGKYYGYGKRYGYGYGYGETHHGGKGERTEE